MMDALAAQLMPDIFYTTEGDSPRFVCSSESPMPHTEPTARRRRAWWMHPKSTRDWRTKRWTCAVCGWSFEDDPR